MLEKTSTLKIYLIGMSLVYLAAFITFYAQIPGLYSDNGLLPVKYTKSSFLNFWSAKWHLSSAAALEVFTLFGIILSLLSSLIEQMRIKPIYFVLWLIYYMLCEVGQVFLWFQWDMLLLESGFLSIVVAPLFAKKEKKNDYINPLKLWLIIWLCFRLMFASGLVKLTSRCPVWWSLDAMSWHYESQCIPTPLAWWAHQLPRWFQRFSVVATLYIESAFSILFFSPLRIHQIIGAYAQIFLMVLILITGNFNFFNVHIIVLHLVFMDNLHWKCPDTLTAKKKAKNTFIILVKWAFNTLLLYWLAVSLKLWFDMKVLTSTTFPYFEISTKINFSQDQFFSLLAWIMPILLFIASLSLILQIFKTVKHLVLNQLGWFQWLRSVLYIHLIIYLFVSSCVPFYHLDYKNSQKWLWPISQKWYSQIQEYSIANSYGLFRSMTGVGGRPEIVIKGSLDGINWKEYPFRFKIGDVSRPPPYIVPYQPRLDWQMWFAALDNYQSNPWLSHLLYKILMHDMAVLKLLDLKNIPFKEKPPNYIKIDSYLYHFTKYGDNTKNWWKREYQNSYFPVVSANSTDFIDYLHRLGFATNYSTESGSLDNLLNKIRILVESLYVNDQPYTLIWILYLIVFTYFMFC